MAQLGPIEIDAGTFVGAVVFSEDRDKSGNVTTVVVGADGIGKPAMIGMLRLAADALEQKLVEQ